MIKKFTFLFLSVLLLNGMFVNAQTQDSAFIKSNKTITKTNIMFVIFTALSPKKDSTALAKTPVKVYADNTLLRIDTTDEDGVYDEIFFLRRICADSISFVVSHPDYKDFVITKYPTKPGHYSDKWCYDCLKINNKKREPTISIIRCGWKEFGMPNPEYIIKMDVHGEGLSSGRVFKREDLQYIPKKE